MTDTIAVVLREHMFTIIDGKKFNPPASELYDQSKSLGSRGNIVCKQNPLKSELLQGIVKPKLSATRRWSNHRNEITLKIEVSLPKLLYGNNFDELSEADFDQLAARLESILRDMGVLVRHDELINAPVSLIHYSKNIPLTDRSTPYSYMQKIAKVNLNQRLDLRQTDYQNGGQLVRYHADSFEVIFYDKIKDLERAKMRGGRPVEKDTYVQLDLFDKVNITKPFEVLRMEARLNTRAKIKSTLKTLGWNIEPTFKQLFKEEIAKSVLLHYLKEIEQGYSLLLSQSINSPKQFLATLIANNPSITLKQALEAIGLRTILEETGIVEFRQIVGEYSKANWYRLHKQMKTLNLDHKQSEFQLLRTVIEEFKPLALKDYLP